jgi:two-component system, chemotaxis family, chemotaxis protein CheY
MASILLIDDDQELRAMVRAMLHAHGHEIHEARDGTDGYAGFRRKRPDVVLCDMCMPDRDGLETIRTIRRYDPAARIVAISGGYGAAGSEEILAVAKRIGANAALPKPFTRAQLLLAVQAALAEART